MPTLEINGQGLRQELHGNRSPGIDVLKCKTNRSVNLPPIVHKSKKKKVMDLLFTLYKIITSNVKFFEGRDALKNRFYAKNLFFFLTCTM